MSRAGRQCGPAALAGAPSLQGLGPVRRRLLAAGQIYQRAPEIAWANTGFVDRIDKVFDRPV